MSDTSDLAPEPEPDEVAITDNSTGQGDPAPSEVLGQEGPGDAHEAG
jgi:hypothetical protein